ncbi:MAG: anthranilate synthase component I, partial [Deltaproteobacteria bacterium]|nr:anthranilate synthase component I [Deltaproteobacteria bacterium]
MGKNTIRPKGEEYSESFSTAGGVQGTHTVTTLDPATALDEVWKNIETRKGALLVSNYEVPDRYARWDIGFVDPPVELLVKGRRFFLNALNGEGRRLLTILAPALSGHPHIAGLEEGPDSLGGSIILPPEFFCEEERSRQPSVFSIMRSLIGQLGCSQGELGFYGAFGFDLVFQFETLRMKHERDPEQVDCCLFLATDVVMVDRRMERAHRHVFDFATPAGPSREGGQGGREYPLPGPASGKPGEITCDHAPGEFEKKVEHVRQGCKEGAFFEVVLSQTFSTPFSGTPTGLFRTICRHNPSPYSFLINMGTEQLVGASPEMFVRAQGRRVETSPISGTVPVGESPMETAAHIKALISSDKEESELTMCTDVDRNDMTRVCVPGTVRLIGRRMLEMYSRVVHTVDHVEGELAGDYDALDAFATHLWACTVTGAPKPVALQTIEDQENSPRRWYAGAVGYFSVSGDLNTGMTLRTVHLEHGQARVRAGATLLYHSDPASEERETYHKASAFLEAAVGIVRQKPAPGGADRRRDTGRGRRVLFVDFLDSFVHTLASYVRVTGAEVTTVRPGFPEGFLDELRPDLVFLSPGPGTPAERGVEDIVRLALARGIPLFGVCLGHQGLAEHFGARLGVLGIPMHGKPTRVSHDGRGFFRGLPNPLEAARYHSLYVIRETLPPELEVTAESEDGVIMALR